MCCLTTHALRLILQLYLVLFVEVQESDELLALRPRDLIIELAVDDRDRPSLALAERMLGQGRRRAKLVQVETGLELEVAPRRILEKPRQVRSHPIEDIRGNVLQKARQLFGHPV